jgi:hypothetical protein
MYRKTYAKIGRYAFNNPNALFKYYPRALVFKNNKGNNRAAVMYWITPWGKKLGLSFATNSQFQKDVALPFIARLLRGSGWYTESSGAVEHIFTTQHRLTPVKNANTLRRTLGIKNLKVNSNGSYNRNIPGVGKHKKKLFGNVGTTIRSRM